MGLQTKKYFNHLICLLIFVFINSFAFSQENLNFGTTTISGKQIKVDKYDCKITPSFTINEGTPEKIKLDFNIVWVDKKGKQAQQPDKTSLFLSINSNIDAYCSGTQKKLSTKPGLFSKKNIQLTNSISFTPAGVIDVAQYSNIHFRNNMPPVILNVLKFIASPVTFNLQVYIGREKGNSLEIDEKGDLLSWKIILPEVKQDEEISCEELESKYNQRFNENKPRFLLGYFETKLAELESDQDTPIEKLWELKSNLIQYKSNVNSLVSLRETIKNNPSYKKCDQLPLLIGSINSYTADISAIQNLIDKVNRAIQSNAGGSGAGGGELPFEAFHTNNIFCENTFNHLYDIKINPDLLNGYEPDYLDNLYSTLQNLKVSQDSLYNIILSSDKNPEYKRAYNNFNDNHSGAIAIIEKLRPGIKEKKNTELNENAPTISRKRSFPYTWIIIPLLIILVGFGVFKYLKYIKKGKSLNKKIK